MGIGDLFKSERDRSRDKEKKRRKAFREAEKSVEVVQERLTKLKRERDKAWTDAREYLRTGQKAASQRALQTCRASELIAAKLEMKRWVFEQLLSKLEIAKTDQDFAGALGAINAVVEIDPEKVDDVLAEVDDKLGEQVDTDKIWERMYGKEMEGVENKMVDRVPSLDEMQKQLEDEAAASIDVEKPLKGKEAAEKKSEISGEIGEARDRIKKLLEEDK